MVSADFVLSVEFCSDLVLSFRQTMNMVAHGSEIANLLVVKNDAVLCWELHDPMLFAGLWHIEDGRLGIRHKILSMVGA